MAIKIGSTNKIERVPGKIDKPADYTFIDDIVLDGDSKSLMHYAFTGSESNKPDVSNVDSRINSFLIGTSLNSIKTINRLLSSLEKIEDKMSAAMDDKHTPLKYFTEFHTQMMARLTSELNMLKDKEELNKMLGIFVDNRTITHIDSQNNTVVNPILNDNNPLGVSRESRMKLQRVLGAIIAGDTSVLTNKTTVVDGVVDEFRR